MIESRRPTAGLTQLRRRISATDTEIPVLSLDSLRVDADKLIGDEFVRCSSFISDANGHPVMSGCQRGVAREDGGSEPRSWPGGTSVSEVGWTAVDVYDALPTATANDEGREIHLAGGVGEPNRTFVGSILENGTPFWDEVNDATLDTGTLVIAAGVITLPRIKPNVAIIKATVDTEGAAASDYLTTITNTGTVEDGTLLIVRAVTITRNIEVLDTGNITLGSGSNSSYSLTLRARRLVLSWDALDAKWAEVSRSTAGVQFSRNGSVATTSMTALDINAAHFDYIQSPVGQIRLSRLPITPVITRRSNSVSVGNTSTGTVTSTCNADEVCISCGVEFAAGPARWVGDAYVTAANGCYVSGRNNSTGGALTLWAHAMCMKVPLN